jgi:predicted RNase H-like HicB family nuclease
MSFSYAVIRHDADGWHVTVNDFAQSHEVTTKTLPDLLQRAKRLIEQAQGEQP